MKTFNVITGAGGFKIVDDAEVIYGSFLTEDEADLIASRLNKKWEAMVVAADHLGSCGNITCDFCKACRAVIHGTAAVRS